jgi:hypothetical protein
MLAAEADNARLRVGLAGFGVDLDLFDAEAGRAALNTGKEVMPNEPDGSAEEARNIGPGDQAVAGAARYRTKPVVKEAIQWTGENLAEVLTFTGKHPKWDEWFSSFEHYEAHVRNDRQVFKIKTLEGTMEASPGDWIIRGLTVGQCYPCRPDIFAATYELVPGAQTTICDDCGNASLAHSLAVWTEDGASYCPSCRPEIAASPIRKEKQP